MGRIAFLTGYLAPPAWMLFELLKVYEGAASTLFAVLGR